MKSLTLPLQEASVAGGGSSSISLVGFIPTSDNQLLDISDLCSRAAMIFEPLEFLVRAHD